jgi:hypothetical protein
VAIGISGWLSSPSDVYQPWEVIDSETTEPFALRFELDAMLRLGNSLQDVLFNYAWDGITYTVMSRTLLGALYAGLWPLGLIKVASVLDNPFSVALARADKAGKVLAHALIDGVQGKRPVTLIGYSVGARVIYACLIELAERHAFGLVESVVLMGAPASSDSESWRKVRSVVAARVVNVYSSEDYVLGYLYRSTKLEFGVAGLEAVQGVHGLENIDTSKLVSGHDRYKYLAGKILVNIGFGDVNFNKVAEQERALEIAEQKKQRVKEEAKKIDSEELLFEAPIHTSVPNLMDDEDEVKPSQPRVDPRSIRQAPINYTQSRSKQQPARQRQLIARQSTSENQRSSSSTSTPASDPLGATGSIETAPPAIRQASFATASAMNSRQMPSKINADPSAQSQPLRFPAPTPKVDIEGNGSGVKLVDATQLEPFRYGQNASPAADANTVAETHLDPKHDATQMDPFPYDEKVPKAAATVAAKEVPVAREHDATQFGPSSHDAKPAATVAVTEVHTTREVDTESEIDFCEDDLDEVGSEFGELSMVEPVPLDDFDYGLM